MPTDHEHHCTQPHEESSFAFGRIGASPGSASVWRTTIKRTSRKGSSRKSRGRACWYKTGRPLPLPRRGPPLFAPEPHRVALQGLALKLCRRTQRQMKPGPPGAAEPTLSESLHQRVGPSCCVSQNGNKNSARLLGSGSASSRFPAKLSIRCRREQRWRGRYRRHDREAMA